MGVPQVTSCQLLHQRPLQVLHPLLHESHEMKGTSMEEG